MQKGARGLVLTPSGERRQGVRHALLRTLPGRAIVLGLVARLVVYVVGVVLGTAPPVFGVVDTAASVALAVGAGYFVFRLLVTAKRRLLWRVRRKLILSYIFIGFIPALLIVAFFLLCGFLLFYNFSSYLVQSRLRALADESRFLAPEHRAGDSVRRRARRGGHPRPAPGGRRRASCPASRSPSCRCRAPAPIRPRPERLRRGRGEPGRGRGSPGAMWSRPAACPAGSTARGSPGTLAYTSQRADPAGAGDRAGRSIPTCSSAPPRFRLAAPGLRRGRRRAGQRVDQAAAATRDRRRDQRHEGAGSRRPMPPGRCPVATVPETDASRGGGSGSGMLNNLPSLFVYRDWESGESGTLTVAMQLSIGELYDRITSQAAGRNIGQGLLLVLFIIGGLFLVIESWRWWPASRSPSRSPDRSTSCSPAPSGCGRATSRTRSPCTDRRSARRAGAVVQLDDREHRGSAPAGGGEEAARGGAAHRARDPDVAAAAGAARDARARRSRRSACRRARSAATTTTSSGSTTSGSAC